MNLLIRSDYSSYGLPPLTVYQGSRVAVCTTCSVSLHDAMLVPPMSQELCYGPGRKMFEIDRVRPPLIIHRATTQFIISGVVLQIRSSWGRVTTRNRSLLPVVLKPHPAMCIQHECWYLESKSVFSYGILHKTIRDVPCVTVLVKGYV